MLNDATTAIYDGCLEEAIAIRRRMLTYGEELGISEFAVGWATWIIPARVHLGNANRALESNLQGLRDVPKNLAADMILLYCLAHLGRQVLPNGVTAVPTVHKNHVPLGLGQEIWHELYAPGGPSVVIHSPGEVGQACCVLKSR